MDEAVLTFCCSPSSSVMLITQIESSFAFYLIELGFSEISSMTDKRLSALGLRLR